MSDALLSFKKSLALAGAETARRQGLKEGWLLFYEWGQRLQIRQGEGGRLVIPESFRAGCFESAGGAREINPRELLALVPPPLTADDFLVSPALMPARSRLLLQLRRIAIVRAGSPAVIEQRRHWEFHRQTGAALIGAEREFLPAILADAMAHPAPGEPARDWEKDRADWLIFSPPAAGILLHELAGHPLELDHPLAASVRAGTQLLPLPLTLYDDPRLAGSGLESAVDDEGIATARRLLLRAGRVAGFIGSCRGENPGNQARVPGCGRRVDALAPALPRASVLVAVGGEDERAALLEGPGRRVLVERVSGQLQGSRVTLRIDAARPLRGGRPQDESLQPFTLRWSRNALIGALTRASRETAGPHAALCEKAGQSLPIATLAPWLEVRL